MVLASVLRWGGGGGGICVDVEKRVHGQWMEDLSSMWIVMRLPLLTLPLGGLGKGNSMGLILEARRTFRHDLKRSASSLFVPFNFHLEAISVRRWGELRCRKRQIDY